MALGKRKLKQDELFIRTGKGDAWEAGVLAYESPEVRTELARGPQFSRNSQAKIRSAMTKRWEAGKRAGNKLIL